MVDYAETLGAHHGVGAGEVHDLMRAHETALLQPLLDYLASRNDRAPDRAADAQGARARPWPWRWTAMPAKRSRRSWPRHGIMAGGGDFYAGRALTAMGVDLDKGVLRLSFTHYTSTRRSSSLLAALDAF